MWVFILLPNSRPSYFVTFLSTGIIQTLKVMCIISLNTSFNQIIEKHSFKSHLVCDICDALFKHNLVQKLICSMHLATDLLRSW